MSEPPRATPNHPQQTVSATDGSTISNVTRIQQIIEAMTVQLPNIPAEVLEKALAAAIRGELVALAGKQLGVGLSGRVELDGQAVVYGSVVGQNSGTINNNNTYHIKIVQGQPTLAPLVPPMSRQDYWFPEAQEVIGRNEMIAAIQQTYQTVCASEHGQLVLLTGKPGYGRGALARRCGALAAAQGATVVYGQCFADPHRTDLFAPNSAALLPIVAEVKQRWPNAASIGGPLWVWVMAQVCAALGDVPTARELRVADDPSALRKVVRDLQRPCVFILERLEYATEEWRMLFASFAKAFLTDLPLLVVATITTPARFTALAAAQVEADPAYTMLALFQKRVLTTEHWLDAVTVADVAAFIGASGSADLPNRLHNWSGGQPVILEDVWTTWIRDGVVERDVTGRWIDARPNDISGDQYDFFCAMLQARLGDEQDDWALLDSLLSYAAIEGIECTAEVISEATTLRLDDVFELFDTYTLDTDEVPGVLKKLGERTLSNEEVVTRYRFTSLAAWRVWDRYTGDVAAVERKRIIADALDAVYHGTDDAVAERLIVLFEATGQPKRAQPYRVRRQYAPNALAALLWQLDTRRFTAQTPYEWQGVFNLHLEIANLYLETGHYPEAEQQSCAALELPYAIPKIEQARAWNTQATSLQHLGDYASARPLYERALATYERTLGAHHPDTALSLNNLAALLDSLGDSAAARPLYERALAIRERTLGADHPTTAQSLNNLAALFQSLGDYAAARPLYERALAIREAVLGPHHPNTATSLNNLAALLYYLNEFAEAQRLMQRALAIREQTLPPNHPDIQSSRASLAAIEAKMQGD